MSVTLEAIAPGVIEIDTMLAGQDTLYQFHAETVLCPSPGIRPHGLGLLICR